MMAKASGRPQGVILDVDGTLIDSNRAHAQAWVDVLRELGYGEFDVERVHRLIGMGGDRVVRTLTGLSDESPDGKRLTDRRAEIFKQRYLPSVHAFPRTRDLVQRLRDDGLTIVVATSSRREELGGLLEVAGVRDLIEDATTSSDAEESKPAPDIVEAAIERSGHDAGELVMLGDTPYDVEAARRAGVRIIALRCGGWEDEALAGAAAIYDAPADLLANYQRSPLVRTAQPAPAPPGATAADVSP